MEAISTNTTYEYLTWDYHRKAWTEIHTRSLIMNAYGSGVAGETKQRNFIHNLKFFRIKNRFEENLTKCKYLFMLGNGHTEFVTLFSRFFYLLITKERKANNVLTLNVNPHTLNMSTFCFLHLPALAQTLISSLTHCCWSPCLQFLALQC